MNKLDVYITNLNSSPLPQPLPMLTGLTDLYGSAGLTPGHMPFPWPATILTIVFLLTLSSSTSLHAPPQGEGLCGGEGQCPFKTPGITGHICSFPSRVG